MSLKKYSFKNNIYILTISPIEILPKMEVTSLLIRGIRLMDWKKGLKVEGEREKEVLGRNLSVTTKKL